MKSALITLKNRDATRLVQSAQGDDADSALFHDRCHVEGFSPPRFETITGGHRQKRPQGQHQGALDIASGPRVQALPQGYRIERLSDFPPFRRIEVWQALNHGLHGALQARRLVVRPEEPLPHQGDAVLKSTGSGPSKSSVKAAQSAHSGSRPNTRYPGPCSRWSSSNRLTVCSTFAKPPRSEPNRSTK